VFNTILVPLDGSRFASRILFPLRRLIETGPADALVDVTLLRVVEPPSAGDRDRMTVAEAAMRQQLDVAREALGPRVRSHVELIHGDPGEEILRYARDTKADLVAMATHGRRGLDRWLHGSVAEEVLRHCEAPVLIANPGALERSRRDTGPPKRLLVPHDGSELADEALRLVEALCRETPATEVTLLRVQPLVFTEFPPIFIEGSMWEPQSLEQALEPQRARLESAGIKATARAAHGPVAEEIIAAARDVDFVTMVTHGRSGVARLVLGSNTEEVARVAPCPLLVLHAVGAGARVQR
jgi:nucleotide-binding universal stress UspA family protein